MIKITLEEECGNYLESWEKEYVICGEYVKKIFGIESPKIELKISNTKLKDSKGVYIKYVKKICFEGQAYYWSFGGTFKDTFYPGGRNFSEGFGNLIYEGLTDLLNENYDCQVGETYYFYISIKAVKGK